MLSRMFLRVVSLNSFDTLSLGDAFQWLRNIENLPRSQVLDSQAWNKTWDSEI